jgi:periplasmic divalent cation tolerance protein
VTGRADDVAAIEVQVTCGSTEEADSIAEALIAGRLAACVQQFPMRSTFRWEGEVQHDDEILLLVKTTAARFDAVRDAVLERHSYDVPAITAVPIVAGSDDYLAWIVDET